MVRSLVFGLLSVLPVVSSASAVDQGEKFGYEHLHLDVGAGTTNEEWLDNSNATTVNFGGNYLFTNNWLFNVDYSAQFFHPDDFTLRIDRLLVGGGYRQGITPLFDIYATYGVGAIKAKATNDKTDNTLSSDSELLQAVTVGVNYLLSEKLIATAEVEVNRSDIVDENNVKIGFNYQWHDVIGSGLFYQFRDTDYSGESSDYINEVGLSLKFIY